jgi:hypothetical protein
LGKRLPKKVKELLEKSKESCILAVDVYNKPRTSFRSGAYVVFMIIAWTSLFHAIFERDKVNYYYKKEPDSRFYKKIDGDKMAWEVKECAKYYFKDSNNINKPIKKNLELFIPLRNKIEHRLLPELDETLFGECQALLHNFEYILDEEFGEDHCVNESLVFSLQFAHWYPKSEGVQKNSPKDLVKFKNYIEDYREGLDKEVYSDPRYSFKVYLIPKIVNNPNKADCAMEFIKFDSSNPEEMKNYEKITTIIHEKHPSVSNKGLLKAGEVAKRVKKEINKHYGLNLKFHPNNHLKCCEYYQIRPKKGDKNKEETKTNFCKYDAAHDDYLYTEDWVNYLIKELKNEQIFVSLFPNRKKLVLGLFNATEVSKKVKTELNKHYNAKIDFGINRHRQCCLHYGLLQDKSSFPDEKYVKTAGSQTLYTKDWVDHLISKLSNKDEFLSIFPNHELN